MNRLNWEMQCADVTQRMSEYVSSFVTPLSMSMAQDSGVAWGSGTYIQGPDAVWILTAGHVITDVPKDGRLAHLPIPGGEYNAALGLPTLIGGAIDAGALPVYPSPQLLPAPERVVPSSGIAPAFRAVDEELFFWIGFPGHTAHRDDLTSGQTLRVTMFNQLYTPWKPMLMQGIKVGDITHPAFDATKHVGIHYPLKGTRSSDGKEIDLPHPKGMSGSALWDTKYVASFDASVEWKPEMAEICGVIWGALDNPYAVLATKIEHIRGTLPDVFKPVEH